MQTKYSKIFSF